MVKAGSTGALLADILSRTKGERFTLVGHSLGCRVIFYALEAMLSKKECVIDDVILLGGAVGNQSNDWERVLNNISGKIYNCFSKNDSVLDKLYTTSTAFTSNPIGFYPIETRHRKIQNIDCSNIVNGHLDWKEKYSLIYKKLYI